MMFVTGLSEAPIAIATTEGMTVESLKLAIENQTFAPASQFTLAHNGAALTGTLSLEEGSSVEALVFVDAGMRAKWRKKRMRRLRRKRRKMRQRAR